MAVNKSKKAEYLIDGRTGAMNKIRYARKKCSATGNRTPVSRVTGGDTHHYTIVETLAIDYLINMKNTMHIEKYTVCRGNDIQKCARMRY